MAVAVDIDNVPILVPDLDPDPVPVPVPVPVRRHSSLGLLLGRVPMSLVSVMADINRIRRSTLFSITERVSPSRSTSSPSPQR